MENCNTCKAFEKLSNECRLNAPVSHPAMINNQLQNLTLFPITKPTNWCLQWQAREAN